jgi:hypothetical protein
LDFVLFFFVFFKFVFCFLFLVLRKKKKERKEIKIEIKFEIKFEIKIKEKIKEKRKQKKKERNGGNAGHGSYTKTIFRVPFGMHRPKRYLYRRHGGSRPSIATTQRRNHRRRQSHFSENPKGTKMDAGSVRDWFHGLDVGVAV